MISALVKYRVEYNDQIWEIAWPKKLNLKNY